MRNFNSLVNGGSGASHSRSVAKRIVPNIPINRSAALDQRSSRSIQDVIKVEEKKNMLRWEEKNIGYNPPVMTVGIIDHNMAERLWMSMESLKNQANIAFAWELIVVEEDGKSRDIIASYIGNLPGCVRVIFKGVFPGSGRFTSSVLKSQNIDGTYTCMEKFCDVMQLAHKNSNIFVRQEAGSFSPHNRLYNHFIHFRAKECFISTQLKGYVYDVVEDKVGYYDGNSIEPYSWDARIDKLIGTTRPAYDDPGVKVRAIHLNTAFRLSRIRHIPLLDTPMAEEDLDDTIFIAMFASSNKRPEESSIVRYDTEISKNSWETGISILDPGESQKKRCVNYIEDLNDGVPEYVIDRLRSMHYKAQSDILVRKVSSLQNKRDHAKKVMEAREREQQDMLKHKQELASILEKRILSEKALIKAHKEQQAKLEMQQLAFDKAREHRESQERQLIEQNNFLQNQLQEEAARIELETRRLNERALQLKNERLKEEALLREKRQQTERLQREKDILEQTRIERIKEEDKMMKEADSLQLRSVEGFLEVEKTAKEMRNKIAQLEEEQRKEEESTLACEKEYAELKAQERSFEITRQKHIEQQELVIKEKEQLRQKLMVNSNRIHEDANKLNTKLKQIQEQKIIEQAKIAQRKAEKEKVKEEELQLGKLLRARVEQEEALLTLERKKIKQQERDLALARVQHNNNEETMRKSTETIVEEAKKKMKSSQSLRESSSKKQEAINIRNSQIAFEKISDRSKFQQIDTYNPNVLLVLLKSASYDIKIHTDILRKELECDVLETNDIPDPDVVGSYGTVIWQNVNYEIPNKLVNQKYVYVVYSSIHDGWFDKNKEVITYNNVLIDTYIYGSETIKERFEQKVSVLNSSYVIREQNHVTSKGMVDDTVMYQVLVAKYKDILEIDHKLNNRICIVTAVTGGYDNFRTFYTNNLKCYVYSDTKMSFNSKGFINIMIKDDCDQFTQMDGLRTNNKRHNKLIRNMMVAKYFKIKHHSIPELKDYDYTVWIDGRTVIHDIVLLKFKIYDLFLRNGNLSIAMHRHVRFDTMYQDAVCCKDYEKDDYLWKRYNNQDIIGQYLKYYDNGFVCKQDYQECGFLIRNNRDPKTKRFFDAWWDENLDMTYQDQVSFRYLVQHLGINVKYIGDSVYDNPYSIISEHNAIINKQYRYNHETNGINKSFDLWDTLIGRICFSNTELFNLIERRLKIKDFAAYRVKCEEIVCKNTDNNFTIDDVYEMLHSKIDTNLSKQELVRYEFLTEVNLTFNINENIRLLDNDSIVVSDFFYDLERMSHFFRLKQLWIPNEKLFVSNDGKMTGDIWKTIPYDIKSHMGDNKWSDCDHPVYKERGIVTHHFDKDLNKYEDFMLRHKFDYVAYVMRSVRLSNPYTRDSDSWNLWDFYCTRYLPVMFLKLYSLKLLFDLGNERMVFMSRDGYLMLHLFKAMFPSCEYDYIYISRNSMRNADEEYIRYVKDKISGSIVIDLLGSGKSFTAFCKKHDIDYKSYVLFFMARSNERSIEYFPSTKMYAVFNYYNEYIERLNYAVHGSFAGFNDKKVVTCDYDYDVSYYIPIYRVVSLVCNHVSKVRDVLSEYNFDEDVLYEMLYSYFGSQTIPDRPSSFSQKDRLMLDKIGHEDSHDSENNTRVTDIDKNYFLDLDEFLETQT
jgi:hypothetical protein